jgi:hypothetical protein
LNRGSNDIDASSGTLNNYLTIINLSSNLTSNSD